MDPLAKDILNFWFETTDVSTGFDKRTVWFRATPEFDEQLVTQFADVHAQAASGALDHFMDIAEECLALIVSLDQFPRNIFRGTARAFATDAKAREIAIHAIDQGYDRNFSRWPRTFCYLPFEHSEELADHHSDKEGTGKRVGAGTAVFEGDDLDQPSQKDRKPDAVHDPAGTHRKTQGVEGPPHEVVAGGH